MSLPVPPPGTIGETGIGVYDATVAALSEALADGSVTSAGLTAFYLSRIAELNPALRAVLTVNPDAEAEAHAQDRARHDGPPAGPLTGIPVLIKDNIAARGLPATAG